MKHWALARQQTGAIVHDFAKERLIRRLRSVLNDQPAANGTPAVDVLATALLADQRTAGASAEQLASLTDQQLMLSHLYLDYLLSKGAGGPVDLPFGTRADSTTPGSVKIGLQQYVLDAGRPGLHEMETVSRAAHGPNLEGLRNAIARKTVKLACRRIGLPTGALVVDYDSRELIQFAPLAEAGGVVLQRHASETGADRFCSALPKQVAAFASDIVIDMRTLWTRRKEVGAYVARVRLAAEAGLRADGLQGRVKIKALVIDMKYQRDLEEVALYIEYEGLDEALRTGTVVDFVPAGTPFVKAGVWPAPYSLRYRVEEREALNALGADGEIDEMAAAIARLAPEGTASVLSRLASDYETLVRIPTGSEPLFATLYWRNGVIRADVSVSGSLDWYSDQLELRGTSIRKTQRDRLPGRPLSAIPGLPFKCDARISHVDASRGKHLLVTVELGTELVNCATGTIWAKPDARSELRCA